VVESDDDADQHLRVTAEEECRYTSPTISDLGSGTLLPYLWQSYW